eukprot:Skav236764  [mRNA]  locus=scaffold2707:41701:42828:+ [translate_table: standard]
MPDENLNRLRWRYFSQTTPPCKVAFCKALTFLRTFAVAYLVVLAGQLVICTFELDQEKLRRGKTLYLQERLKDELSNETFALLLESGFVEVQPNDPFTWDFLGSYSRSLMFSFATVSSIGYGNMAPITTAGQVFCMLFTVIATPALVVVYGVAARKMLDFMQFAVMLMDEKNLRTFKKYDCDESGQLTKPKFKAAMHDLGYTVTNADVNFIMEEINICDSDVVTIEEFGHALVLLDLPKAKCQKARQATICVICLALFWLFVGTFLFMYVETWGFLQSMWFCWETLMTIGLGDIVPQTDTGRWVNVVYSFIGLGVLALLTQTIVDLFTKHGSIGSLELDQRESPHRKSDEEKVTETQRRREAIRRSRMYNEIWRI